MSEGQEKSIVSGSGNRIGGYPEYTAIEEPWAEKLPAHWELSQVKRHYDIQVGKMLQTEPESQSDSELPYLKARHIRENGVLDMEKLPKMWFAPNERLEYALKEGDVLISEGGDVGRAAIWPGSENEILYQNALHRARPIDNSDSRFFYYWITWLKNQGYIDILCNKATISHYTAEKVEETPFPVVPVQEQNAISDFLDYHTENILDLIERKERLLDLIEEKRQATLNDLLYESDDVEETRLKYVMDSLPGYAFSSDNFTNNSEDIRLLRGTNVGVGDVNWEEVEYWPQDELSEFEEYALRPGDIVLGMDRPWISDGIRVAQIEESDCPALLVQRVLRIRASEGTEQRYIKMALESDRFRQYFEPITTGVSVPHISEKQVGEFTIPYPPQNKQKEIVREWEKFNEQQKQLRQATERSIELLEEKQKKLIDAAVTGKIAVKDWELPTKEEKA